MKNIFYISIFQHCFIILRYYGSMKILFTRFPLESAHGGAEKQTISLMLGLQSRGHAVSFLGSCPVLLELCAQHGIPHVEVQIGKPPVTKLGAITFFWRKRRMQKKLRGILNEFHDLDALFMLSLSEKIVLTETALRKNIKVIWQEHDTVGRWLTSNPSLPKLTQMSARVTTVCVSELSAEIFRGLGYQNVVGIPNGVALPPDSFTLHEFDETLRVGCIARLSPEKGVDVLLEAMQKVNDATLLIAGKGPLYIQQSPTVNLRYEVPDINSIYKEIDVLVLPSRKEDPFGLVVAEAMLRGIAVVCTDACGIAGYLQDGNDALIVPAENPGDLAVAINSLYDSSVRAKLAQAGKDTALKKFTVDSMVERYEDMLNNVH